MRYLTLGILAHVDGGKTTLCERLLFETGAKTSFGRVDKGESFLDYNELERKRGITIFSKEAKIEDADGNTMLTLLDTPGHVDFVWETLGCMEVMDAALLVIDAASPISAHSIRLFNLLKKNSIPTFVFFNKMDLCEKSHKDLMADLRKLDPYAVDFTGDYSDIIEEAATADESLLELFLEKETLSCDELAAGIARLGVTPVFFGSALGGEGVDSLIQGLFKYISARHYIEKDFLPYKVFTDAKGNRMVLGKALSTLSVKGTLFGDKIEEIREYNGEKYTNLSTASVGMMVALRGVKISANIVGEGAYKPLLQYEMETGDGVDAPSAIRIINPLIEENPVLDIHIDKKRKKIHLSPMGDIQLEILKDIILERFGLNVSFSPAGVVYKETVSAPTYGVGHFEPLRHYSEVHLLIEPNPGGGILVDSNLSLDELSANWQSQILYTAKTYPHKGVLTGADLTDVKITLVAGKSHEKHTEGGDFRESTKRAVREGLMESKSIILEPLYAFDIRVASELSGKVLSRLELMEARVNPPVYEGEVSVITGTFPVLKLSDFPKFLASLSSGKGELALDFGGYIPIQNPLDIISEQNYNPEADIENPADSVFTSHGSSVIIPWYEVKDVMHLPFAFDFYEEKEEELQILEGPKYVERSIGTEEIDKIIGAAGGANRRKNSRDKRSHWNRYSKGDSASEPKDSYTIKAKPKINYTAKEEYLLVDGYNIIFSWDELNDLSRDNIDAARDVLLDVLSEYSVYTGKHVILVFDAYKVSGGVGSATRQKGVDIIFTKEAQTADAYIEKVSKVMAKDYLVRVATSDRLEQMIVWGNGAFPMSARELKEECQKIKGEIRNSL